MKKLKGKFLSLVMSLVLVFNVLCPVFASGENQTNKKLGYLEGKTPQGYITLSIEKFTLGLGYIQEPVIVPYYEGDNGAKVVDRVLGSENYKATGDIENTFYISGVKDDDYRTENIPTYILERLSSDPTSRKKDGWLCAFDYTQMSGWMYTVANEFPNVGVSGYEPQNGDVMRWQFTVYGYGEDLGASWGSIKTANKDKLTTAVAKINSGDNKLSLLSNIKVRKAYDKANNVLTNMESTQDEVDNALKSLESSLKQLGANDNINKPSPSVEEAISSTGKLMINTVPKPDFGTGGGEWTVLSLARGNISVPKNYYGDYYKRIEEKVKSVDGVLDKRKYTEYSRLILALSSIDKDARDVAGYNMVAPLADYQQVIWQGINGPVFALIALDSRDYNIPTVQEGKEQATRDKYIDYILSKEIKTGTNEAGGWALTGTTPDPDITAMALQALAPYKDNEKVAPFIERALTKLSNIQKENGGYASWGTVNSESIAQVIVALCELGIDPTTDVRFIKEKNWLLTAIMEYYCEGGGFKHTLSGTVNGMATDQAMYALVAYQRFLQGKNSLYDMTDVISMSLSDVTLQKNESKKLELKINGGLTPKDIYWSTDDDKIATVSQDGTIEGMGVGTTKVHAYVNGQDISCNVNVQSKLTGVKISKTELSLDLDKTYTLIATADPVDAMGDATAIWKSEDESIAKVDKNGLVAAVGAGRTNIVAQIGEFTAKCSVTVNIPITKVTINPSTAKISVNKTIKLSAITEPDNSTVDKTVTWTTSSNSIATVDKNGVVTGKKAGNTNIYGKVGGKSAYCKVTVISEDEETVSSVIEKINKIGDVTLNNKEEIEEIRNAYNSLTDEQKKYVTNLNKLLNAEETISKLEIEKVKTIISKIPDEITLNDEDAIKEARKAYDSLKKEQQELLNTDMTNNISKIKNAENTIISIKAVNKAFVDNVVKAINSINLSNGYSDKNKTDILSAKSMYDSLSEDQKLLIDNSTVLKLNKCIEEIKDLEINNFVSLVEKIQRPALEKDMENVVIAISAHGNMDNSVKNNNKVKTAKAMLDEIVLEIGKDNVNKENASMLAKEFADLQLPLKYDRSTVEKAKMLINRYESLNSKSKKYFDANSSAKESYNKVITNLELIKKADEFDNKVKDASLIVTNKKQLEEGKLLLSDFKKLSKEVQDYILTDDKINNLKDLVLKGESDLKGATKVDELISKIPSKITENDYEQIREVKSAYDKLSNEQKNYVEKIDRLNSAVSQLKVKFDNNMTINNIKYNATIIKGKGQGGAKVQAYVGNKLIGSSTVLADGTYSIKISKQAGGTKITVKMIKDGYISQKLSKTVLKQIKTFTVNRIKPKDKLVTGKGMSGAIVRVYSNNKEIGKATVDKNGKYSVKIPTQKLYSKINIKISKSGYYTQGKTTTVLKVFSKKLIANSIKSTSTKISGKGEPGATIRVYVNEKQIGKSVRVSKNSTYSINIPKQKKNTKITIKMSKTATASVDKDRVVK
ncbi:Ig-like domain-containing protein [Terrisporobacter hibernicus]|uniref:Ig-like domain-containing protein n=1 Tax=Terrisporobacter hibernicus TaxID=2813371 RepID=A0AAX2ZCW7_9FIRM|nr:Ig-like domain-containing protein [Terrisporobacter hibernicus]UEL46676.1 Ig-like domain-containing protein [Terrisporobacter hibernicus]